MCRAAVRAAVEDAVPIAPALGVDLSVVPGRGRSGRSGRSRPSRSRVAIQLVWFERFLLGRLDLMIARGISSSVRSASREAAEPDRHRIGICTLYAPYASRRHGGGCWLAPVSVWAIRRKAGAGERTRTADLLTTNHIRGRPAASGCVQIVVLPREFANSGSSRVQKSHPRPLRRVSDRVSNLEARQA